jgi:SAM-dependent methyltransferase
MPSKDFPPVLENTGERVIPDEEGDSLNYQVHQSRYEYASRFLKSDGEVLDYGSGTGYGLHYLAQATTGRCIGVDKPESVAYASKRYPQANVSYVAADLNLPEARFGQFDLIVSFDVIEHVQDIDGYLANILAQLRNDQSVALISTPWSYRHNNLFPAHNPFHECELTNTEFFDRLDPFFTIDQILLTMGMMARVRRKGSCPNYFPAMCIELPGAHIAALEEGIEELSLRVESLEAFPDLARAVSRRLLSRRVDAPPLVDSFVVGEQTYWVRPVTSERALEGRFVARTANLSAIDIPLALYGEFSSAELHLTLLRNEQTVAQVTWPALLLREDQPHRFLFPPVPLSTGAEFRWVLETVAESDDGRVGVWGNASGEPLWQEFYRRYRWEGPSKYGTITEWIAPQLRPWLYDWPALWTQRQAAVVTHRQLCQPSQPSGISPPEQRPWPPDTAPLTKLRLALQHYSRRAVAGEVLRYFRRRFLGS